MKGRRLMRQLPRRDGAMNTRTCSSRSTRWSTCIGRWPHRGAARFLGSALNLKPVLTIAHGRVESLEKVRSRSKSLRRLIEIAQERLGGAGRRSLR